MGICLDQSDVYAQVGEARTRDKANIAPTDHCDAQTAIPQLLPAT